MAVAFLEDSTLGVEDDAFSGEFTASWPAAEAAAADDAVAVVMIAFRSASSTYASIPTVSVGGVEATAYAGEVGAVGFGSDYTHLFIALVPLAAAASDQLVIGGSVDQEQTVDDKFCVQAAVFTGVDDSALADIEFVKASGETTLGPVSIAANGALVVAFGNIFVETAPWVVGDVSGEYAQLNSGGSQYYPQSRLDWSAKLFAAATTETLDIYESGGDDAPFSPGIAFALAPPTSDNFNCTCEDETNYRTLAELRADIINRLSFSVAIASSATLSELRERIIARLGFVTLKDAIPGKTLTQLRTYLLIRTGFAAQIADPPPGVLDLLDAFINEAQDVLWRRYAYDGYGGTAPPALTAGTDTCTLDSMAIQIFALAAAKAHYGHQDAKSFFELSEQMLKELLQRHPLNLEAQIDECINQAQETLWRKHAYNGGTAPARMAADDDECTLDAAAIELLAMANAKAFYKQDDAKSLYQQLNEYLERHPFNLSAIVTSFLQDAQRQLYRRYSALRTERFYRWTMVAGERFYDLPDNDDVCAKELDAYRITWVGVEDLNGTWYPLTEGINPTLYTNVSRQGLPARYEVRQCIEVLPAPDQAYTLRVKGHFGLEAFAADDDKTTIDDQAVFLLALGQAKLHYKQQDGQNYLTQAASYMGALVAGAHHTARYVPRAAQTAPLPRPRMVAFDDE